MRLLAIASHIPIRNRASGDLRFFHLLKILASQHAVTLTAYETAEQRASLGDDALDQHISALKAYGVSVVEGDVLPVLRSARFDAILIEFHYVCRRWIDQIRFEQPKARVIVDSVDCHFLRLQRRAQVTGRADHLAVALAERAREVDAYARSDMVLTVTEEDARTLAAELPDVPVSIVPNIHSIPPQRRDGQKLRHSIVFVGSFGHDPNVDAVHFFCRDILPAIRAHVSTARLTIVGSDPPAEVLSLAGDGVEVLGSVANIAPILERASISVAPLRYGAGQKGKVGEAMSYGLPVVTTSVGAEGFPVEDGTHCLLADSPEQFAEAVVRLLREPALARRIGARGRALIARTQSEEVLRPPILQTFERALRLEPRRLPATRRLRIASTATFERNVGWRLRRGRTV